jgi:hypothetical protein
MLPKPTRKEEKKKAINRACCTYAGSVVLFVERLGRLWAPFKIANYRRNFKLEVGNGGTNICLSAKVQNSKNLVR